MKNRKSRLKVTKASQVERGRFVVVVLLLLLSPPQLPNSLVLVLVDNDVGVVKVTRMFDGLSFIWLMYGTEF